MDEKGVFGVARSVWDCDAFMKQRFTQREAWLWLVGAAMWRPGRVNVDGQWYDLERGEFCWSSRFLAKKWRWSKDAVLRFMKHLKSEAMLCASNRASNPGAIPVYSINKYNEFQVVGLPKEQQTAPAIAPVTAPATRQPCAKEETLQALETLEVIKVEAPASAVAPRHKQNRGTRWPENQQVPDDWIAEAETSRLQDNSPSIDLGYEARRFENYWVSKAGGAAATKLDWRRTWLNWATDKGKTGNGQSGNTKKRTATDQHLAGIASLASDLRQRRAG